VNLLKTINKDSKLIVKANAVCCVGLNAGEIIVEDGGFCYIKQNLVRLPQI